MAGARLQHVWFVVLVGLGVVACVLQHRPTWRSVGWRRRRRRAAPVQLLRCPTARPRAVLSGPSALDWWVWVSATRGAQHVQHGPRGGGCLGRTGIQCRTAHSTRPVRAAALWWWGRLLRQQTTTEGGAACGAAGWCLLTHLIAQPRWRAGLEERCQLCSLVISREYQQHVRIGGHLLLHGCCWLRRVLSVAVGTGQWVSRHVLGRGTEGN